MRRLQSKVSFFDCDGVAGSTFVKDTILNMWCKLSTQAGIIF